MQLEPSPGSCSTNEPGSNRDAIAARAPTRLRSPRDRDRAEIATRELERVAPPERDRRPEAAREDDLTRTQRLVPLHQALGEPREGVQRATHELAAATGGLLHPVPRAADVQIREVHRHDGALLGADHVS